MEQMVQVLILFYYVNMQYTAIFMSIKDSYLDKKL